MHIESEIAVRVLLRLMEMNIVALPLHDGFLAPSSKANEVGEMMVTIARDVTCYALPISMSEYSDGEVTRV
jgi:hypothetical protein